MNDDDDKDEGVFTGMPLLLTKAQAAAWAQVSVSKLDDWMHEPGFPAISTPHHVRIHAAEFDSWLARKATRKAEA